ncbi:E3 ubiquitin-protein ligase TRIM41-like [Ochotona curzoniae]|uniref:E3 ubiquitin-protein ligase TRIM41-like n=1 Tax=Ochotona curzoniae TaxID=130825 RepID=UPI001B34CB43|nr:E3 ubiquitin-protein ligase TRIM41-like [Ochotona curzoniae]
MGGTEDNLRVENKEVEEVQEEDKQRELDPNHPVPPFPAPTKCYTCPQCQRSISRRTFRPNLQLANMVLVIRQMYPMPGVQIPVSEYGICPKHQKVLKLFCQVDEEPICVPCQESESHKHHSVVPLDEVVQEYKDKLRGQLEPLRNCLERVQNMKAREEKRITELQKRMESELTSVAFIFIQLTDFLLKEQAQLDQGLRHINETQMMQMSSAASDLSVRATQLSHLLAQVEEQSGDMDFQKLNHIKKTLNKCREVRQEPLIPSWSCVTYQPQICENLKAAVVRKMKQVFCTFVKEDLTLDPDTAHPNLILSTDCRMVHLPGQQLEDEFYPKRSFSNYYVLASQGFCSGRHYWEVEVSGPTGWALGVADESFFHKQKMRSRGSFLDGSNFRPSGCNHLSQPQLSWGQSSPGKIWCMISQLKSQEEIIPSLDNIKRRLGVYLDYEAGHMEFYLLHNLTRIRRFTVTFLGERVFPFFRLFRNGTNMKICS